MQPKTITAGQGVATRSKNEVWQGLRAKNQRVALVLKATSVNPDLRLGAAARELARDLLELAQEMVHRPQGTPAPVEQLSDMSEALRAKNEVTRTLGVGAAGAASLWAAYEKESVPENAYRLPAPEIGMTPQRIAQSLSWLAWPEGAVVHLAGQGIMFARAVEPGQSPETADQILSRWAAARDRIEGARDKLGMTTHRLEVFAREAADQILARGEANARAQPKRGGRTLQELSRVLSHHAPHSLRVEGAQDAPLVLLDKALDLLAEPQEIETLLENAWSRVFKPNDLGIEAFEMVVRKMIASAKPPAETAGAWTQTLEQFVAGEVRNAD